MKWTHLFPMLDQSFTKKNNNMVVTQTRSGLNWDNVNRIGYELELERD